jgi:hypothetical protein
MRLKILSGTLLIAAGLTLAVRAQVPNQGIFTEDLVKGFTYRNLGPFRMGARTSDIAVPVAPAKAHLYTFYVGFWTGGVWKTTNNGTTFEPVFDGQARLAIGDIALAPSNADIVWVGTGDAFVSRSSYVGDGIYKSTDGAQTWKNMGLRDTHHIAKIAIHPTNPDIVYVASIGSLYSDNAARGVFKTTNGGETWEKILFINERVGVIDLILDARNPSVLYAAAYEKQRLPWQIVNGGPGSGIYKSTDAGAKWTKLAGGLPDGRIGRIGLDLYHRNSNILYAVIENQNPRTGAAPAGRAGGPAGVVSTIGGEVYRTENAGQSWTKMNAADYDVSPKGPYYFSQIFIDPNNDQKIFVTQDGYRHSIDGGRTWNAPRVFPRMFGDYRTLWIDPENSDRMIAGSDGGITISYDAGRSSDHYANIPVGEIYAIGVDMEDPYNIYAGLQDHEHWKGPSNGPLGRVTVWDWFALGDGDGMFTQVDPKDSRWLYTTRHYGGHTRVDQKGGFETNIAPQRAQGDPYRFLWATPLQISPHDSNVIYTGAQVLLRSTDRGDRWTEISPDLSTNPRDRILPSSEGGVPGGIPWFAISSIAESPITRGVIWAGTSDGKVHLTRDTGASWTDMTAKLTAIGAREDGYVTRVRASAHAASRAYVAKSGYKFDDFRPFLYKTEDFGATWTSLAGNLPNEPINVVYEDLRNPDLLFVGNDTGVFVSIDRGRRWVKMNNNMPNVPVHDLLVHPRENDLILGSYGRDLWVTNVGALQELTTPVLASDAHLFTIKPGVQRVTWVFGANDYLFGQRHLSTPNEPDGMVIRYYLKDRAAAAPSVVITNAAGQEVARFAGGASPGINTVLWSMRVGGGGGGRGAGGGGGARGAGAGGAGGGGAGAGAAGGAVAGGAGAGRGGAATAAAGQAQAGPGRAGGAGAGRGGAPVIDRLLPLGDYTVTLEVAGKTLTQKARIAKTQGWTIGTAAPFVIR